MGVRVVAATNRNLNRVVAEGSFLLDLYYRLADFVIKILPLRQRRREIASLAHYFLELYHRDFDRDYIVDFSGSKLAWLQHRSS